MSRMTGSYDLGRASAVCAATGDPLTPGTPIVAALVDVPGEEDLARVDTLASAWDRGLHPAGLFAFWRTTVPPAGHKPKAVIDDQALMDLFQSLDTVDDAPPDDRRLVFRYILALLLVRRRRLILRPDAAPTGAPDGTLRARIRGAQDDDPDISIAIPSLDADALAAATDQLSALIGTGA